MKAHVNTHQTLEKKKDRNGQTRLKALSMDLTRCTAVKNVPQCFWESAEFENLLKNLIMLVRETSDPLAEIKKILPRKTRARETAKLNDEIGKVNFYQ